MSKAVGTLMIVGEHESIDGERRILEYIAKTTTTRTGALVLVTVATDDLKR